MTYTVVMADVAIEQLPGYRSGRVFVQDFNFKTEQSIPSLPVEMDMTYIRVFENMRKFTEWCIEYKCIINRCFILEKANVG